ncbi:MAG: hypothetical protein CR990_00365 [Desulfococcus sp.]|nr:MAG: hypothetical protein CR990_00365 [Desulfococcus sp.]
MCSPPASVFYHPRFQGEEAASVRVRPFMRLIRSEMIPNHAEKQVNLFFRLKNFFLSWGGCRFGDYKKCNNFILFCL